jgi:serine/threonine protein kinase
VTQVGKYQIIDKLGEGAMGVVYRAMDPVLNRHVAIKIMSEGLAQDAVLRERFLREAQAAGSLQHPNLVTIYDFGEIDGHLFIAMEFIKGVDLEQLLKSGPPLPLSAKLDIVIDVLNGLAYAHRRGVIHRDIKPANIRVDEDGHARIMDFGVAHLGTSNLTTTGVMVGTPNYMAPEQISGDPITPSVDLFSVGAMLYELLTNAKPFQGDTLHNVLYKIVTDEPPDVSSLNPECTPELTAAVNKALAKTPVLRWKSAADMANALMAVRAKLGTPRLSKTVSQRVSIENSLKRQQAAGISRQTTILLVAGSALAAAVLMTVGFVVARGTSRQPEAASSLSPADTKGSPPPAQTATPQVATVTPVPAAPAAAETSKASERTARPTASAANSKARSLGDADRPATARRTDPAASLTHGANAGTGAAPVTPTLQAAPNLVASVSAPPATTTLVQTPPVATPQPPVAVENPREGIAAAIAAYTRAIASRDVDEIRRAYPRVSSAQETNWKSFFSAVRSISANFEITSLDVNGSSAVAQLAGAYQYVTTAGRTERQPITVRATLLRDAGGWKIQRIE